MNHKVMNLQNLHNSSMSLYNDCIVGGNGSADSILSNLKFALDNLKVNWKGKDAGIAIHNVTLVYNAMLDIRKHLGNLSVASSKVASNYRKIQNSNGAKLEEFSVVSFDDTGVSLVDDSFENSDTIDINPAAEKGKQFIDKAIGEFENFTNNVNARCSEIMENWVEGDSTRDDAVTAFDSFKSNSNRYKELLDEVSSSIATALNNYRSV